MFFSFWAFSLDPRSSRPGTSIRSCFSCKCIVHSHSELPFLDYDEIPGVCGVLLAAHLNRGASSPRKIRSFSEDFFLASNLMRAQGRHLDSRII